MAKQKQGKHGLGRLYKRDKSGKEHPADSKVQGVFYLEYRAGGKRTRERLTDQDGVPVKTLRAAEKERVRIMAPFAPGDAVEHLKAIQAKLATAEQEHVRAIDEANPPLNITDAWAAYLSSTERPDTGEATLKYYAGYWERFRLWLLDHAPDARYLRDITSKTAKDYATALGGDSVSPNTYNKHTGFLRLFFRVLEEPGRMQENPFERIRKKKLKTNVRRELTIAELKEILEAASGDLQTLLYLGTFTGLRLGDCCTLKWGEVDLDRGTIRRIPNKTAKSGKPVLIGIPAALHEKLSATPKTKRKGYVLSRIADLYTYRNASGKPTRQPDISNEIQQIFTDCEIQTHKEGTGKDAHAAALAEWEVGGKKGAKPIYKRAVVEVGFHSLRHTYVSMHAEAGTPQAMIQANVGHSNPAMTAHYTHIGEGAALEAAKVLTLNEPEPTDRVVPPWIEELAKTMTAENWEEIKAELIGGKE